MVAVITLITVVAVDDRLHVARKAERACDFVEHHIAAFERGRKKVVGRCSVSIGVHEINTKDTALVEESRCIEGGLESVVQR